MEKTYLDYFNYYLKQCINDIISYFPYTKTTILENYRSFLEGNDNKNDIYVKYFMTKANEHLLEIAKKDPKLFENKVLYLIEGINFHELWNSPDSNDNNKIAIWKYLQLLILLGRKCIPNKSEIVSMLEKVGGTIEVPSSLDKTLETKEKDEEEETSGFGSLLKGLGDLTKLGKGLSGGKGLDLGSLGGLGELAGLGDGLGGIMKMAQTLSESLKDIDLSKLQEQMTNLNNNDDTQEINNNDGEDGEDGKDGAETSNDISNLLGGSLFGDLANEMANTFNFDEMEAEPDGGTPDIGKTLGNFMKGDNPAKFMNLINKFGSKLQTDMKSGKVNQNDLINQTSKMMGNLEESGISSEDLQKQAAQMFGANSPQVNRVKNNMRGQSARERLQKKLADKNNNQ
jgi:hypothetical protein